MALLRCPCGTQFSLDSYPANGLVFCPGCGRQHALPALPAAQTSQLSNPQTVTVPGASRQSGQANAVLGFILSLMSFFTCLLLAPLAVYFSFKGLRERDGQGFAIAGLILGIFQSISLVFLVAYFVFMAIMIGGVGAALAAILAQLGLSAARTAEARLKTLTAIQDARVAIQEHYEEHNEWPTQSQGTQMIREHHDAWDRPLRYEPIGSNQHAIVSAGQDGRFGSPDDISERWRQESAGDASSFVPTPGVPPHPMPARESIASGPETFEQCIADLSDSSRRLAALSRLREWTVDEALREQVSIAVDPLLASPDRPVARKALEVVAAWGPTSHNLDSLIALQATAQVARIRDPRVLDYLGEMLDDWPIKFNAAARELRRIGPAGESRVWPVLKNDNHVVANAAIRLLGEIGTRESLPHLEKLRDHRLLQPHVLQAVRAIEAAGREPVEWSAEE